MTDFWLKLSSFFKWSIKVSLNWLKHQIWSKICWGNLKLVKSTNFQSCLLVLEYNRPFLIKLDILVVILINFVTNIWIRQWLKFNLITISKFNAIQFNCLSLQAIMKLFQKNWKVLHKHYKIKLFFTKKIQQQLLFWHYFHLFSECSN